MKQPSEIEFTELSIDTEKVFKHRRIGPMDPSWTRVQFSISNTYEANERVELWLTANTPGRWDTYSYEDPKSGNRQKVVRFASKDDALMFKLRGGHQC